MTDVSVVIPCYNQGEFLPEAVESVRSQTHKNLEIIIVDDGSDDGKTSAICQAFEGPGVRVLATSNQGLAAARNNGIALASGTYILPLDADDRIAPEYIEKAVEVLERDIDVGIVYCKARLFGAVEGEWRLPDYSLEEILKDNVIFCSALFRKDDWEIVGGYDPGMVYGWEDYDFWLSLIERGRKVHRLQEHYFFYRVSPESMVRSKEKSQKVEMFKRIFQRHQKLFSDNIEIWLEPLIDLREQYLTSRLYVDCGEGLSDSSSIARKIEPGKRTIKFPIAAFKGRRALRLDPADCPISIEINKIELVDGSGSRVLPLSSLSSNALIKDRNVYMFATDDPMFHLNIDESKIAGISEVAVTCNPLAFGSGALQHIIDFQKNQSAEQQGRFSLLHWFKCGP
jgi:glycosyltransferase involved in cell wall biosynthesis